MTPRELFDRALAAINAGDAESLLSLYHPLVVQLDTQTTVRGRDALRPIVEGWLGSQPQIRELAYAEAGDTIVYEAETDAGRGYGTLVLRDGLIWRETQGRFPLQAPVAGAAAAPTAARATVELAPYRAWNPRDV